MHFEKRKKDFFDLEIEIVYFEDMQDLSQSITPKSVSKEHRSLPQDLF